MPIFVGQLHNSCQGIVEYAKQICNVCADIVKHVLRNVNDTLVWTIVKNAHMHVEDVLKNVVKCERQIESPITTSCVWIVAVITIISIHKIQTILLLLYPYTVLTKILKMGLANIQPSLMYF
jgi:phage-related protein